MCDGNPAAPNYDIESNSCKCGSSSIPCSGSTPFCVDGNCLCSAYFNSYVKGISTRGTCQGIIEACLADGTCIGIFVMIHWLNVLLSVINGHAYCYF